MNEDAIFSLDELVYIVDYDRYRESTTTGFKQMITDIKNFNHSPADPTSPQPYFQIIWTMPMEDEHIEELNELDIFFAKKPEGYDNLPSLAAKREKLKQTLFNHTSVPDEHDDGIMNDGEPDAIHFTPEFTWPEGGYEEFVRHMNT